MICVLVFCVTWLWTWQKRQLRRVDRQFRTGLIYSIYFLLLCFRAVWLSWLYTCSGYPYRYFPHCRAKKYGGRVTCCPWWVAVSMPTGQTERRIDVMRSTRDLDSLHLDDRKRHNDFMQMVFVFATGTSIGCIILHHTAKTLPSPTFESLRSPSEIKCYLHICESRHWLCRRLPDIWKLACFVARVSASEDCLCCAI